MKKIIFLCVLLFSALSFAQKQDVSDITDQAKIESFEDIKAGVSFKYKPNLWKVFLDKKNIDGNLIKDFAIIKRRSSFNQIRIHIIQLKTAEDFQLSMNKYRDAIIKERVNVAEKSRGRINRELEQEELKALGAEKGRYIAYSYADKFREINNIELYFMLKESKIYVLETYIEKRSQKEDKPLVEEVVKTFKIINN